jgi:hypothetical protein
MKQRMMLTQAKMRQQGHATTGKQQHKLFQ